MVCLDCWFKAHWVNEGTLNAGRLCTPHRSKLMGVRHRGLATLVEALTAYRLEPREKVWPLCESGDGMDQLSRSMMCPK